MYAMHRELEVEVYNPPTLRRGFITSVTNIAGQRTLRPDPKYRFFWDIEHGIVLPHATVPQVRLGDCLLPFVPKFLPKGDLEETRRILELADVEAYTSIILLDEDEKERMVSEVGSTKLDFKGCDLVITRLRPYLGKIVLNDLTEPFIGTSEWIPQFVTVIDTIFANEFGFELDDFKSDHDNPMYQSDLQHFGGSLDLRGGVRFHRPKFSRIEGILKRMEHRRFREVVIPPIRLGATVHPTTDYDDNSEIHYISPDVIKKHSFNLETARTVSEDFYQKNFRHYGLKANDLVIARSGEGTIGKAALFTEDEETNTPCIHSDFTMRVRFNSRIIPEFGYYFCCSKLFQSQVERSKRGMGNMTNFFPGQLLTFWIACPSLERQRNITERIHNALRTLEEQHTEIKKLRDEIDFVILQSISDTEIDASYLRK